MASRCSQWNCHLMAPIHQHLPRDFLDLARTGSKPVHWNHPESSPALGTVTARTQPRAQGFLKTPGDSNAQEGGTHPCHSARPPDLCHTERSWTHSVHITRGLVSSASSWAARAPDRLTQPLGRAPATWVWTPRRVSHSRCEQSRPRGLGYVDSVDTPIPMGRNTRMKGGMECSGGGGRDARGP